MIKSKTSKLISHLVYLGLCSFAFVPAPVSADDTQSVTESPLAMGIGMDLYSDYIWRGQNLYKGLSFQPAVSAAYATEEYGSLSASVWSHLSGQGDRNVDAFTEVDYTVSYSYTVDAITASIGHLWYAYPRESDAIADTSEMFATLSVDTLLSPVIGWYKDYDEYDSNYFSLRLSHGLPVNIAETEVEIKPYIEGGFGHQAQKYYDKDGLVQLTFGVTAGFALGDFSVTPSMHYTYGVDENTVKRFWSGVNVGYAW